MIKSALTLFFLIFSIFLLNTTAQKESSKPKQEGSGIGTTIVTKSGSYKPEPYLSLEPCAKETPEQITELENAPSKDSQINILVKRISGTDDWLRACAIYRLGEFRNEAQVALPVILKLLRDEENTDVWVHVETALWKIPPERNMSLAQKINLAGNIDVYNRIYGVYLLSYFEYPPNSGETKKILETLIQTAKDDDVTVSWLSVMGIRQQGFYGVDTSDAIPVLSELIKNSKLNPVIVVRAFVPMGEKAIPAAPFLFDILYNPKNYVNKDKDEDNTRSYGLYLTTAIALGKIGNPLIPLLEKEVEKHPFEILQVLGNISADGTLPILYKAIKDPNPNVRKKAIESLPGLTSFGAVETLPYLLKAVNDENKEAAKAAVSKIGSIAKYTENKSEELKIILKNKALPALIDKLNDKELGCYTVLNIPKFGADGEIAIPAILRSMKKDRGNYCSESALYDLGEAGRKHLTPEKIKEFTEQKDRDKDLFRRDYNNAKPIKPKIEGDKDKDLTDSDT